VLRKHTGFIMLFALKPSKTIKTILHTPLNMKRIAIILLLLVAACQLERQVEPIDDQPIVEPVDDEPIVEPVIDEPLVDEPVTDKDYELACAADSLDCVVAANNEFAVAMYKEIDSNENIFFSPWSISSAMAIAYEGARGQTAEEMAGTLHMVNTEDRLEGFRRLSYELNRKSVNYTLSTANALWAEQDYAFLSDYVDTVVDNYLAEANNVDFMNEAEQARQEINRWVEQKTSDKIKNLIPQGAVDSYTRLVITNAIYFKAKWLYEFDPKLTFEQDFGTGSGTVTADMMQIKDKQFNFGEEEGMQVLELPYEGEDLSMLILLPDKDQIDTVDLARLEHYRDLLGKQKVIVYMPKFKFETKYYMGKNLVDMGMPTAFGTNADFSGMTGNRDLSISAVIHQAYIDVNEEGTEAAAATGVVMATSTIQETPVFIADHPFVFVIQHKPTGQILFIGKVMDPTS